MNKYNLELSQKWKERLRLYVEGNRLCAEANKLRTGDSKIYAKSSKLHAEGCLLCAKGDKLWTEAVLNIHGNIAMKWKNWNIKYQSEECHLGNGEVYGFDNLEVNDNLKLYVWEDVLIDLISGIMFALANNVEEARVMLINCKDHIPMEDLIKKPKVYEKPFALTSWGGGS